MTTQSPLHIAARNAQVQAVKDLLRNGAPVDAEDGFECTPLGDVLLTYSLIQRGGVLFSSPNNEAAVVRRLATIWFLLREHGANIERALQLASPLTPATSSWVAHLEAEWVRRCMEKETAEAAGKRQPSRL